MSGLFKAAMRANYHKDENGFKVIYTKVIIAENRQKNCSRNIENNE